ncbi:DNA polymerase III subunit delta [Ammoniphilus resinae]|uniref:DNA polymerase III subunit delta n=1 Tax=Ammoniphilus resinae TaxID=861532 RepID=A0ABS4GJS5_9BACL|nr:DNA polymerase III subunit delta [Ammoniphilus resinae]MBP1930501.1 DNA polymerase-3 subunit delta [Ammoniphilus resinae]
MDSRNVFKRVQQNDIDPLYTLYGSETFLSEEFIRFLKGKVLDQELEEFNLHIFDLNETPIQDVIQEAETLPFMGEKRLIIGKNAMFLTGAKQTGGVEHHIDALLNYIQQPLETTVLVLAVEVEKLDERKKVVKLLQKHSTMVAFSPLKEPELISWIQRRAQKLNAGIDDQAANLLKQTVGTDLRTLHQELEKIASYVGARGTITEDVVYQLASRTLEQDIFSLVERVVKLDMTRAMRIFYDLLKNKEEPLTILSLLVRQFRLILHVKILLSKGYTQGQIASQLGIHPYPVKLAAEKVKNFSEQGLRNVLAYLAEEDYRIKSGKIDKKLSLELFMMRAEEILKGEKKVL